MDSRELRRSFLEYFRGNGHVILPSSSLVPNDPTLLFTSAGMVQFKNIFWGRIAPRYPRVATCQKCFRTTDIERVGKTGYHHTFFEMLGNFSFGDYFKEGAIELAWRFLTQELSLPGERLWVSVYEEDEEAYEIWRDAIGIPSERIVHLGKEENWWGPVGDSGPCGPDSEIYWDFGTPPCGPDCKPGCDCGRFSEIWNLVFTEYEFFPDGRLEPLKQKNIDTGMGLERMTAVLEGVQSNFETDLFLPITEAIRAFCPLPITDHAALNLIADHIRGAVFLVAAGVLPSNDGRGYVFRRILRRMVRAAQQISFPAGALAKLTDSVAATLGDIYPEIVERKVLAESVISEEERSFRRTLRAGEERLRVFLAAIGPGATLSGEKAFELYDTYGFPFELTQEIAQEQGVAVDRASFDREMGKQRARSRKVVAYDSALGREHAAVVGRETSFVGYETLVAEDHLAVILDQEANPHLEAGQGEWKFILSNKTPFYAEAGGQIADTGRIENLSRPGRAEVLDVQKSPQGTLHMVRVTWGEFRQGDRCRLEVDADRRKAIARAHTATHLLHAALRKTIGEHVIQAGSWVGPEELRFDFTHFSSLAEEEIKKVEELANRPVLEDIAVCVQKMPLDEAKAYGAIAHFEEEYQGKEKVRVVEVPGVSKELCGGTHVARTGEIGPIVIIAWEGVAAGTRRIRALVGQRARQHLLSLREERRKLSALLAVPEGDVTDAVQRLLGELRHLHHRLEAMEEELWTEQARELAARAEEVAGVKLLGAVIDGDGEKAKKLADILAEQLGRCAVIVGTKTNGHAVVVAKVREESRLSAGELVKQAAAALGGRGGGQPTFAQGGGPNVQALPQAIDQALSFARRKLGG